MNQNEGCCWAFSAVAAMEGIIQLTAGCDSGLMDDAFPFIEQNKGLTTEANYPYKGADSTCNANKAASHAAEITGFEDVPAKSEAALMMAVARQPVSVAIEASGFGFQFYSSGIFTESCDTKLEHGVTAVCYGVAMDQSIG
ncbi:hypothetical protein SADUNF_Sadunf07G0067500 [Salix dunnii]|uniref:Peptidase C1A papain C-terminal domain-containing protein n=1 Tax=Salix dunnii TaxID=1413687 RepID=A0A835JZL3_9ROSI|nr:hypothetical protein SADUNF_Sadunf07G0067500 [Salix dunnii]